MDSQEYDLIVVGVGGVGSAALYYAARKGWKVLGIDPNSPGHDHGSSHGQSRIIRQAYFEHPNYVPLVLESYELWEDLEQACGQKLKLSSGLLQVGPPAGNVIQGILRSASDHQLRVEELTVQQIQQRFPWFCVPEGHIGLYETAAGILLVEECVKAFVDQATRQGAHLQTDRKVTGWDVDNAGIAVHIGVDRIRCKRLILTMGAWSVPTMTRSAVPLRVVRKHQHWFDSPGLSMTIEDGCPTFFFETDEGSFFYGFPKIDQRGVKIAEHSGGEPVVDPGKVDRSIDVEDLERIRNFAVAHFKGPPLVHRGHSVCMYTLSPDEHFVVDRIDDQSGVVMACGLSGHGFKFAPVIGQYLVDLVDGRARSEFDFLRSSRFQSLDRPAMHR